ncbi:MAG: tetratricopeptide repeat protein [Desulfobacteraceae bacterium]|nr:MAG: tetratricopeptide repeat protein [Desulfobacteraceae bacterium]
MNRKIKMSVAISLILLGGFFLLFLPGCSALRNMVSWIPFLNSPEEGNDLKNKELAEFVSSIRPHQRSLDSIYRLACYFQERKKHKLAVKEFRKIISIDPTFAKAYNGMGISYDSLGEFPRAVQSYEMALALNPDLDYAQNNLGYSYLLRGDLDSAIEAFQKAITLNNHNRRYHNNLGLAYARKGQFDLAFAEFKLAGDEAGAHYNMGQFYYQNGLYREAKIHFAKSSTINPANRNTQNGLSASKNLARISQHKDEKSAGPSSKTLLTALDKQSYKEENSEATLYAVSDEAENQTEKKIPISATVHEDVERERESTSYTIGVGAFRNPKYAQIRKDRLINKDYSANIRKVVRSKPWYMVNVGSFETKKAAEAEAVKLSRTEGLETFVYRKKAGTYESMILAHSTIGENKKTNTPYQQMNISHKNSLRDMNVEISNGNGVIHMASRVRNYLREKGFKGAWARDASHFDYEETKIYYCSGYLHDAYRLAQEIPGWQTMKKVAKFKDPKTKIKIVIGKDLIPFDEVFSTKYQQS